MTARLLLIDDDARLTTMVADYLRPIGFEVDDTAGSLASGRERLRPGMRSTPCVLDLMLPDGDGLDLTASCAPMPRTRHLPLLMLTARGEPMDRIVGLELGADDYLPKPFEPRELLARVKALLRAQCRAVGRRRRAALRRAWRSTSARARHALDGKHRATSPATSSICWWCWRKAPAACCRATRSWMG